MFTLWCLSRLAYVIATQSPDRMLIMKDFANPWITFCFLTSMPLFLKLFIHTISAHGADSIFKFVLIANKLSKVESEGVEFGVVDTYAVHPTFMPEMGVCNLSHGLHERHSTVLLELDVNRVLHWTPPWLGG